MQSDKVLYLSQEDVKQCLSIKDALEAVELGIKILGEGNAIQPRKTYLVLEKYRAFIKPMIAYVGEPINIAATKNFTFFPENRKHNKPTIGATIILNDPDTGTPLAIMDGTWITGARTAAATAIAAKYLAKPDSAVVGIFGAGLQGRTHLMALNEIFKLKRVQIADISKEYQKHFADEMGEKLGLDIVPVASNELAVKGADIVITVTTAKEPLVKKEWVEPGMFVAKAGSYQELDLGIPAMVDKIVVDWWDYAIERATEIIETNTRREDIYAELAEIVAGIKKGREHNREKILFISIGMGVEDAAAAFYAYKRARELGIGQNLEL